MYVVVTNTPERNEYLHVAEKSGLFPFEIWVLVFQNFPTNSHCIRLGVPFAVYQSHPLCSAQLHAQAWNPLEHLALTQQPLAVSSVWAVVVHDDVKVSFTLFHLQHKKKANTFTELRKK